MSTKNNQNLRKELDYNFLDEEWSDDDQGLISIQELQTQTPEPPAPAPEPVTTPEEPTEINVIENKEEKTSKMKMKESMKRHKFNRKRKPKLKKKSMNILSHTKNMMIYLQKPEVIKMRKELSPSDFKAYVAKKFEKLAKDYDRIFNKTLEGGMNLDILAFMCTQHERLRRGGDQYNTDATVGQRVFNEYAKKID
jgi:hypothetical protein